MPKEHEGQAVPLTAIHINLKERSIVFEAQEQAVAKLTFASSGTILFKTKASLVEAEMGEHSSPSTTPVSTEEPPPNREREQTITVTGRLKDRPKEGRPDGRGNPTAWARLAAHEEGRGEAHMYLATFHRHTAKVALALAKEAQITVEGYPHSSQDAKRMDTLSVVNILQYPGKPDRRRP